MVVAFGKRDGRPLWRSEYNGPAGHSSGPVPIAVDGIECVAALGLEDLVVMRVDKGHEGGTVATYTWKTDFGCNLATPAVTGDHIVLTAAYDTKRTDLVKIGRRGAKRLWTSKIHSLLSSPVVFDGRVYLVQGPLSALDLDSGAAKWRGGSFGHGTCVATKGDGRLICFGGGRLALVEARGAGDKYRELAAVGDLVPGICYPQLAFSDGLVAVKDKDGNLVVLTTKR
jgi:hypothetical protein